ncbi:MAG: hypothetical protein KC621_21120 [Myxococcales bacterium]|nr:hypothetical protein [Myxococcales bacterium]
MIALVATAWAEPDLRATCTRGVPEACDRLASELAARIARSDDPEVWIRLAEVHTLLTVPPTVWPDQAAEPVVDAAPRCPGEPWCTPRPPDLGPWSVRQTIAGPEGALFLLGPSWTGPGLSLDAAPVVVMDEQGRATLLPVPFCRAGFTTSDPPAVLGPAGPRCDHVVRVGLDGTVLADVALESDVREAMGDGERILVARREGWSDLDGHHLEGEVIGVDRGEPVMVETTTDGERTVFGTTTVGGRCRWDGRWVCLDRGLWWTLDDERRLAEPLVRDLPDRELPDGVLPSGPTTLFLHGEGEAVVAWEPWSSMEIQARLTRLVARVDLGEGAPIELPSGSVLVEGVRVDLPPGPVHLTVWRSRVEEVRITVRDERGRAVAGAHVRSDVGDEGTTDAQGQVALRCRRSAQAVEGERMGAARCDAPVVLHPQRLRCEAEGRSGFCDALDLEGTWIGEPSEGGYRLVRAFHPRITVDPPMSVDVLDDQGEPVEWAVPGQALTVSAGPYCAHVEARAEPTTVRLERCAPAPRLDHVRVVDAAGEPIVALRAAPDGWLWADETYLQQATTRARRDGELLLTEVPPLPRRAREPRADGLDQLVGIWFREGSPVHVWPDGRVLTGSAEGEVSRSLPGVALVHLEDWSGWGGPRTFVVVPRERDALVFSPEDGPSRLEAVPR